MGSELELLTLADAADALGVPLRRISSLLSDGELVGVSTAAGGRLIPSQFLQDGVVVKGLGSVVTLLRDAHYDDDEIVSWLFRVDDSLPGTPVQALRENRGREVKRRAQVAGF